jgi:hypothetical protein
MGSVKTSIESKVKVLITVTWWKVWYYDAIVLWEFPVRLPSYATLKNWQRSSLPEYWPRKSLFAEKEASEKETTRTIPEVFKRAHS